VRRRLTWLDVFTSRPLAGNGLAVVHDADGLDDPTMLAFARETRLSETTFVQRATVSGADYRNRIWTTTGELDFAGHPSLGTAVAVALVRGERTARYVQQTRAGLQPVEVELDGTAARASMLQEPARFGAEPDAALVLDAVGLGPEDAHADLPPQVVSTGVPQVLVPVGEPAALERLRPRAPTSPPWTRRAAGACWRGRSWRAAAGRPPRTRRPARRRGRSARTCTGGSGWSTSRSSRASPWAARACCAARPASACGSRAMRSWWPRRTCTCELRRQVEAGGIEPPTQPCKGRVFPLAPRPRLPGEG
jgi:predicted PhzF superfamily epimerase YddE/YHI9